MSSFKKYLPFILPSLIFTVLINVPAILSFQTKPTSPAITTIKPKIISNENNVPKLGDSLKIGVYLDSEYTPKEVESEIGSKLNIMAWFSKWNSTLANNKLAYACENGYVPSITWESWQSDNIKNNPYPLKDIASGKFDSYIREQFNQVRNTCGQQTVIIRFDHEMYVLNHNLWYPWQNDAANYIRAWRHIVDMSHKIDQNIKWIWSPNHGEEGIDAFYPGDKWVDYIGTTMNRNMFYANRFMLDFKTFYEDGQSYLEKYNKPIIISETGSDQNSKNLDKAKWVKSMFDYINQNPQITAVLMLNEMITIPNQNGYVADYRLNSSPNALNALRQSINKINNNGNK
jgi:hypothetical protein